ncbi:MAG: CpXC domain-containing protein [Kofleriaceae bacterium]
MSITRTERVECACGAPLELFLADSLNAGRHPHLKQAVLDRALHVFRCDVCSEVLVIEKDMLFFDFERKQFFCVYPRQERAHEAACSQHVKRAYELWLGERAPGFIAALGKQFLVRVCFGYEELREKLVIDDAGLSDLVIEALKIDLLVSDPWFEQASVVTLRLDAVLLDGSLQFLPEWIDQIPDDVQPRVVTVSRALYAAVDDRFDDILVVHPGLAAGAHVSLLRLVSWPELAIA